MPNPTKKTWKHGPIPAAPDPSNMQLDELIDYWSGRLAISIGRGTFRDEVNLMLQTTMRTSYDRGIADGSTGKRRGA